MSPISDRNVQNNRLHTAQSWTISRVVHNVHPLRRRIFAGGAERADRAARGNARPVQRDSAGGMQANLLEGITTLDSPDYRAERNRSRRRWTRHSRRRR